MGSLSDAMQRLVENIGSSAESRHVKISEMVSDNHNLLERFRLEHQDMTKALNEKLSSDNTANKKATQQFINGVKMGRQNMAKTLDEKLSSNNTANRKATQQFINGVKMDRQNMTKALNEKLSSDNTTNRKVTQQFINGIKMDRQNIAKALNEKLSSDNIANEKATKHYMNELASDRGAAQRIWRESFGGVIEKPVQPIVAEVTMAESESIPVAEVAIEESIQSVTEHNTEPFSEKQILEVIAGHTGGIKLVDIGNELGIDWRSLIGIVKSLVDGGKIEKIENLYYSRS